MMVSMSRFLEVLTDFKNLMDSVFNFKIANVLLKIKRIFVRIKTISKSRNEAQTAVYFIGCLQSKLRSLTKK